MQHSSNRLWLLAVVPLLALGVVLAGAWTPASAQQPVTLKESLSSQAGALRESLNR